MDDIDVHVDVDIEGIVLLDLREIGLLKKRFRTPNGNYYKTQMKFE